MQSSTSAPEHSQALREYLAKGMSYSEIADAINSRFGSAYSRKCGDRARQADRSSRPRPARRCAKAATEGQDSKVEDSEVKGGWRHQAGL